MKQRDLSKRITLGLSLEPRDGCLSKPLGQEISRATKVIKKLGMRNNSPPPHPRDMLGGLHGVGDIGQPAMIREAPGGERRSRGFGGWGLGGSESFGGKAVGRGPAGFCRWRSRRDGWVGGWGCGGCPEGVPAPEASWTTSRDRVVQPPAQLGDPHPTHPPPPPKQICIIFDEG